MIRMIDPGTDPVPREEAPQVRSQIGFFGRLFGIDAIERLINERFDNLKLFLSNPADTAALEAARDMLTAADQTIDNIEKGTNP